MLNIEISIATLDDAQEMLAVYAPYVEKTTVSSEYVAPSLCEFKERISNFTTHLPWIVCRIDGKVAGYGYASPHRTRAAYQWSAETSIYVSEDFYRCGIARAIYNTIFEILKYQGYYNIFVGITTPNERSVSFHSSMGFEISGSYKNSMYKFGLWRDVIWMSKSLRKHEDEPEATISFKQIPQEKIKYVFEKYQSEICIKLS